MTNQLSRRQFLTLVGAAGATTALAACQVATPVSPTGAADAAPAAAGDAITVRYLTPSWASTQDRRPERQIAFRAVLDSFNDQYADEGYQVEEVVFDGDSVAITQAIEDDTVESFWFNHSEYASRANAGQLVNLSEYDADINEFFPFVQETMQSVDGNVYALWHNTDTPLYYYNSQQIGSPPQTWSQVEELCQQVRQEQGGSTYAYTHPFVGWIQMNSGLYLSLGGEYVNEEGAPVAFEPENRQIWNDMFSYYIGLVENDLIPASAVANDQTQQMPDVYAGDVYSFAGNSNFHVRQLQPNLPEEEYASWSATPLPIPDAADPTFPNLYQAGGWIIGAVASGDPDREAAAAAWTLHATNARSLANTCKAGAWIPTRPAIIADDPFYADDAFAQVTLAALDQGHVVPLEPIFIPMATAIQTALTRAASGEVDIETALEDAAAETQREYEALGS